jgi:hypothetical protein
MTWAQFFFGAERWLDIVGWHLAVLIAFLIGWYVSHLHNHIYQSHRCVRLNCKRRMPPAKK